MKYPIENLDKIMDVGTRIVLQAGHLLKDGFYKNKFPKVKSSPMDLVTIYDVSTEEMLVTNIQKSFPNHGFLCEESKYKDSTPENITWVIDPIDGTLNFARQIPSFAISVAIIKNKITYGAICYDPISDELFTAKKGEGAKLNNKPISTSKISEKSLSIVSIPPTYKNFEEFGFVRRSGSAVIDLCYVAKGAIEGFFSNGLKPWDYLAAQLIVEESGGKVSTNNIVGDSYTVYANNGHLIFI